MPVVSISGTCYADEGVTPLASKTVSVSINGAADAGSVVAGVDGAYSLPGLTVVAGDVLTLYLDDGDSANRAVTVTTGTGADMTGIDLYRDTLVCRSDNGGSLTTANLATAATNGDTDISGVYSVSGSNLTTAASKGLFVPAGHSFAPSAACNVTTGNWIVRGTFTPNALIVTLSGAVASATRTIEMAAGNTFTNLTINCTQTTTFTLASAIVLTGNLIVTGANGTFDLSASNYAVTVAGNLTLSTIGTFNGRASTVTLNNTITKTLTIGANRTFYNLTCSGAATLNVSGAFTLTVTNALTINAGATLTTTTTPSNLTLTGATFTNAGRLILKGTETLTGFTNDTANGGTITYSGASGVVTGLSAGNAYANLGFSGSSAIWTLTSGLTVSGTLLLPSGTINANGQTVTVGGLVTLTGGTYQASTATQTFNGGLTISGGTLTGSSGVVDVNGTLTLSSGTLTAPSGGLSVSGDWTRSGSPTFTPGTCTVTLDGTNQTISGSTTFYRLAKTVSAAATLTFTDGTTQTVTDSLTLTGAADQLLTLAGSGSAGWAVAMPSTQSISHVSVSRSTATGNAAVPTDSVDGGNNVNWSFGSTAVPPNTGTGLHFGLTL